MGVVRNALAVQDLQAQQRAGATASRTLAPRVRGLALPHSRRKLPSAFLASYRSFTAAHDSGLTLAPAPILSILGLRRGAETHVKDLPRPKAAAEGKGTLDGPGAPTPMQGL